MKRVACLLFVVLVFMALTVEIKAHEHESRNCQGTSDRRCPLKMCGPDGPTGWKQQDNSKPFPACCGGPICGT